ncbi:MAG: hypothetical protein HWQ38_16035 [Nostoc sp. NMS7]|uniref:hypothetical protein n=1 Tax=Nostoc sp. NMS7 TaxID=2815391 RepID=UPI0025FAE180|nr:hypothetical protein [Nostoc sp. NMS7]MBN3947882.1 hypothetical protein [Nostoc sp. NMS7]
MALEIDQAGGLTEINHEDLVKSLQKLENPSKHTPYDQKEWKKSELKPGKYEQVGRPEGWETWDIDKRVNYSNEKRKAKENQT